MGKFFRENWVWILAPILVVLALFVAMLVMQGDDAVSPYIYKI